MENNNVQNQAAKITAASLGTTKNESLVGMCINPMDLSKVVKRVFTLLGVNEDCVRSVKCAMDTDGHPHLIAEVLYKALKVKKQNSRPRGSWCEYIDQPIQQKEEGNRIAPFIYTGLANVAYPANRKLMWSIVNRNDKKYARIEFDPMILIAVAYNINYADKMYHINTIPTRYPKESELDEKSGKERKEILRRISELRNENLHEAMFIVTYAKDSVWYPEGDKSRAPIKGFDAEQVEIFYPPMKVKDKKHKKHHDDD